MTLAILGPSTSSRSETTRTNMLEAIEKERDGIRGWMNCKEQDLKVE